MGETAKRMLSRKFGLVRMKKTVCAPGGYFRVKRIGMTVGNPRKLP